MNPLPQVPRDYRKQYLHVPDPVRRTFAAMTSALDEGIGRLVQVLRDKGVWNNTGA